jgi:hypothetical protein
VLESVVRFGHRPTGEESIMGVTFWIVRGAAGRDAEHRTGTST